MSDPIPQPDLRGPAVAIRMIGATKIVGPFETLALAEAWCDGRRDDHIWKAKILHNPGESPHADLSVP